MTPSAIAAVTAEYLAHRPGPPMVLTAHDITCPRCRAGVGRPCKRSSAPHPMRAAIADRYNRDGLALYQSAVAAA